MENDGSRDREAGSRLVCMRRGGWLSEVVLAQHVKRLPALGVSVFRDRVPKEEEGGKGVSSSAGEGGGAGGGRESEDVVSGAWDGGGAAAGVTAQGGFAEADWPLGVVDCVEEALEQVCFDWLGKGGDTRGHSVIGVAEILSGCCSGCCWFDILESIVGDQAAKQRFWQSVEVCSAVPVTVTGSESPLTWSSQSGSTDASLLRSCACGCLLLAGYPDTTRCEHEGLGTRLYQGVFRPGLGTSVAAANAVPVRFGLHPAGGDSGHGWIGHGDGRRRDFYDDARTPY